MSCPEIFVRYCALLSVSYLSMRFLSFPLLALFFLAACTAKRPLPPPSDIPLVDPESSAAAMPVPDMDDAEDVEEMLALGIYMDYTDDVIGEGEPSILFFHASWCPTCKSADEKLMQWYDEEDFPLTVYKVDYDSNADLRARYGVTYQHTFVLIDGEGNAVKTLAAPSDEDLQSLLQTAL